jgi:hypothetical protein
LENIARVRAETERRKEAMHKGRQKIGSTLIGKAEALMEHRRNKAEPTKERQAGETGQRVGQPVRSQQLRRPAKKHKKKAKVVEEGNILSWAVVLKISFNVLH